MAVAVLLVHWVRAQITTQQIKLATNGERVFSGVSCDPIQSESPELCKNKKKLNTVGLLVRTYWKANLTHLFPI